MAEVNIGPMLNDYVKVYNGHINKNYKVDAPLFCLFAVAHIGRLTQQEVPKKDVDKVWKRAKEFAEEQIRAGRVRGVAIGDSSAGPTKAGRVVDDGPVL